MRLLSSLLSSLLLVGLFLTTCCTPTDAAVQGRLRRRLGNPAPTPDVLTRLPDPTLGFYESRPDQRECPTPYCGGAFVRPIDGSPITCPGASEPTAECYVAAMRYPQQISIITISEEAPPLPDQTGISIVYGRIIPGNYELAPEIYDFEVHDGTAAATSQQIALYYSVQRDNRKCAAPLCGGFWLKALATTKTLCSDGSVEDECYVASLDLSGLGPMPQIVDGCSVKGYYIENPNYKNTSWPDLKDLFVLEVTSKPVV